MTDNEAGLAQGKSDKPDEAMVRSQVLRIVRRRVLRIVRSRVLRSFKKTYHSVYQLFQAQVTRGICDIQQMDFFLSEMFNSIRDREYST